MEDDVAVKDDVAVDDDVAVEDDVAMLNDVRTLEPIGGSGTGPARSFFDTRPKWRRNLNR